MNRIKLLIIALITIFTVNQGYSQNIWNQYENGSGTALGELCLGLNYRLTEKTDIYLKAGHTMTQQSAFF